MAADIDVRSIAIFASVPESTVNSILTEPTAESIKAFLQDLEKNVKHCDQVKSQKTKLEVELETVVRTNESKTKVLQSSRDKALADVSKLREELQTAESTRAQAHSELERLQQSIESEALETVNVRNKVSSLEASHRDTLSLLDSKSKEVDRLAQDLTDEHEKLVSLRRQVSILEQAKQEASSAVTSAKFKQASLEQELDLQKKNVDWYENERQIKNEEHQRFRRDKNARLSELQRSLDQQIEQTDSLRRSENSLRTQLEDQVSRTEDLLKQIEKLQERELSDAEHHRIEVDGLNRLVELHKASADTAKARVDELSAALDEAREDASDEIGRIRAEIQDEHNDRQAAELRVQDLEAKISELEADLHQSRTRPATPRNDSNGQLPSTPARQGTPLGSYTPRSTHRLKNGMSTTQMYSEYTKIEKDLQHERRANEQLQTYVDSMLEDLEASKPQIEELRHDQARLQSEVVEMSQLADEAKQQRDLAHKEASILQGQLDKTNTELQEAQQMCRDLGSQVRRLLLEQRAGVISDVEYNQLISELEEVDQRDMEHLSGAQQNVNQFLISFREISELQAQNEKQIGTIRNLVAQLESEEVKDTRLKFQQLEADLAAANEKIGNYQGEIERMVTQTKSFVKERDMFRSMLTRRGQIDPTDFSRSLPAGGLSHSLVGDHASPAPENDLAKLLRDLQAQYDNFRHETATDTTSLKTQVLELSQRNSQLQTDASRSIGQLNAATQRYEMLQANYDTLKLDHQEMQKRSNTAIETATKQELKTQQAAEDLVEARGMVDGLRRESANLKAEKDLWKSVEKRLIDDNETLRNERSRLDQLNASLQSLLNEREHSDSESRRRYQTQIEGLENELQIAKRKLEEEVEDKKQISQRRSYEHEQSQKRIDELVASVSTTREELASVKTTRDHLQARVDEMTVELRSAEERLEVFTRPAATPTPQVNGTEESSLSREQELAVEVSELKRDLDLKSAELIKVEEHVEEYKNIAQEAEDRLQQFVETNDEDKADLQASINEKEEKIKDLEQRIEDISSELSTTNSELSALRDEQAEAGRRLAEQKAALETEIDRLKALEEKASEQATLYLEASKEQQNIAEQRQQNYETELLKHTEAVKNLQTVRSETNQIRLQLAEVKTEAENAKTDLQQKQTSWADIESRYKQEMLDLKNRREEVEQHNKSLHTSLETLNTQLASLQRSKTSVNNDDAENAQNESQDLSSLHEVIKYLRQEKEIVEVRHHMTSLELERLKRQMDSTQSQLDDARLKLDQQQRATLDIEKNAMNHNKLIETLNELNLHRESAVTLRAEKRQAEQSLKEKSLKLEQVEQELVPLRSRIVELEHLLELNQGQMELLQKDRDSWQQRTQNILSKYDRVDPTELEELKKRVSELEVEKDEALAAQAALQVQVDGFADTIEAAKAEQKTRLTDQFKTRDRDMREKRNQLQAELNAVKEQLDAATARESEHKAAAESQGTQEVNTLQSEPDLLAQELQSKVDQLEMAVTEKDSQIATLEAEQPKFKAREEQMKKMLNERLAIVKKEAEASKQTALEELRTTITTEHQKELHDLKSQLAVASSQETKATDNMDTNHADAEARQTFDQLAANLTSDQAKQLIQKNETLGTIMRNNIRKGIEKEKERLSKEQQTEAGSSASHETSKLDDELQQKFATEKEDIIRQKDEELNVERERLISQLQSEFETEKQAILEEHQKKLGDEVAKAKASAEKMAQGKMNLIQKQSANNLAKVNVVKKAAEETPEKPVKEVWEVAKTAKPPSEVPKPAPAALAATAATTAASAPTSTPTNETAAQSSKVEQGSEPNGAPSPAKASSQEPEGTTESSEPAQPASTVAPQTQPQPVRSGLPQPTSQLPRGNFSNRGQRGGAQGGRGTGIPRPGSAIGNHGINTNVRGRGGSRGGHNPSSPSRGGAALNPQASQFTPGKRPREDGGEDGNIGKRIRGGGAGS